MDDSTGKPNASGNGSDEKGFMDFSMEMRTAPHEVMYYFLCQEKERGYAIESFPEKTTDIVQVSVELDLRID